jgi:hypothetical protein
MTDIVAEFAARIAAMHHQLAGMTEALGVLAGATRAPGTATSHEPTPIVPQEGTQPERVLGFIRQCPGMSTTRAALRRAFPEFNQNVLSGAISRLKDRGMLEAVGRGRYRARVPL